MAIGDPNQKTFTVEITEADMTESDLVRLFEVNNFTYFATKVNPSMQSLLKRAVVFWGADHFE